MRGSLSAAEARRVAVAAQGFGRRPAAPPGRRQLRGAIARMGDVLQIDSVNVFARSHYMPLFSRLGAYDTAELDRLLFARRAPYVESWAHVASFVPAESWGLFAFRRAELRAKYGAAGTWFAENTETVDWVRAELAARGPLRPAEIERDAERGPRGPWWDWDGVKRALEHLFLFGEVAIAGRRGFERRYGLVEQVIPAEHLVDVPREEAIGRLVARAARASGVATAADIADYFRIRDRKAILRALDDLVDAGELSPVTVAGWSVGGRPAPAWLHRDATVPRSLDAAALLTPFDPLVWFRDRAERLFDFEYRIEIYTPAPRRRFGYYSLPVLVDDRIAGRVDLKADRPTSRLLVQSAWWERDAPTDAAARLAVELERAAAWQALDAVSISHRGDAVDDLAAALPRAARHDAGGVEATALAPDEPEGPEEA